MTQRRVYTPLTLHHSYPMSYDNAFKIRNGVEFRFVDAGHLLGSAMVALKIDAGGRERTITFTGDLGRRGLPILRDPEPVPPANLLISESTYGGRIHPAADMLAGQLAEVIRRTFDRGGRVIVPAFSLGRTQTMIWFLHQLVAAKKIDMPKVVVDSPLAMAATEVFRLHPECFDAETSLLLETAPDLFGQTL